MRQFGLYFIQTEFAFFVVHLVFRFIEESLCDSTFISVISSIFNTFFFHFFLPLANFLYRTSTTTNSRQQKIKAKSNEFIFEQTNSEKIITKFQFSVHSVMKYTKNTHTLQYTRNLHSNRIDVHSKTVQCPILRFLLQHINILYRSSVSRQRYN